MPFALITGASHGLGEHYARYLARRGNDLIITARSADQLADLATELNQAHRVRVHPVAADLATAEGRQRLISQTNDLGEVSILVNNAGFGTVGDFAEQDPARLEAEIQLNCIAVTILTRAFIPAMIARHRGAVINVASLAAFQPMPSMAVYAATKAYVLSLTQALWEELRSTGVRALAVCPGATDTDFFANAGNPAIMTRRRSPEQVVQTTFRALQKGVPRVIDGSSNTILGHLSRIAPTRLVLPIAQRFAK